MTNDGAINGAQGGGVLLTDGGIVTNANSGSISSGGRASGVDISGGSGLVTNHGIIDGGGNGVELDAGGSITNNGSITGGPPILGIRSDGAFIYAGSVTNEAGGVISGGANGIETGAGPVTVTNDGTLSGGTDSVLFGAGSTSNLLVISPGAVFHGAADATAATNSTITLTAGTGVIAGIGNGSFLGFSTLVADGGANWTLKGANTIGAVLDDGKLDVSGGLTVSTQLTRPARELSCSTMVRAWRSRRRLATNRR